MLQELDDVTFRPSVNENKRGKPFRRYEDSLLMYSEMTKMKKERLAKEVEREEMVHNTFKPKIDPKSSKLAE